HAAPCKDSLSQLAEEWTDTKIPTPCFTRKIPRPARDFTVSRTTVRLATNSPAKSRSVGSRYPVTFIQPLGCTFGVTNSRWTNDTGEVSGPFTLRTKPRCN